MTEKLGLEQNETILKVVRKHWFILFTKTLAMVIAGILPLILVSLVFGNDFFQQFIKDSTMLLGPALFFAAAWLLLMWMALFTVWTDYYLDIWIITDRRVIAIDQRGFFDRQVSSFRLERMQNLTIEIEGLIETLFDFGDIDADTASTEHFRINGIPKPRDIKSLIQGCADARMRAEGTTPVRAQGL